MLKSSLIKLHAAAAIFASRNGCSAQEIADILGMTRNSVYHLAKQEEWHTALDDLHYTGDRQFTAEKRREPKRDTGELVEQAKDFYLTARRAGLKHSRAVNEVLEHLPIKDRRTINAWAKRYDWEGKSDDEPTRRTILTGNESGY